MGARFWVTWMAFGGALAATMVAASETSAQPPAPRLVALDGGPVMDLPGGTYGQFASVDVANDGSVVFKARVEDLPGPFQIVSGVFLDAGSTTRLMAFEGEELPDVPGEDYGQLYGARAGPSLAVFMVRTTGESLIGCCLDQTVRVYRAQQTTTETLVLTGEPAPGSATGFFRGFDGLAQNDTGTTVFHADLQADDSADSGLWRIEGGIVSAALMREDPAPGTGGGTFSYVGGFDINDASEIAVFSDVNGSADEGIFRVSPTGAVTPVVMNGDAAPGTGGGVFESFDYASPVINEAGKIAFRATIAGGSSWVGMFSAAGGVVSLEVLYDDPAPGGGTLEFSSRQPAIDDAGRVYFHAGVRDGPLNEAIFAVSGGVVTPVVAFGDAAPPEVGGIFNGFRQNRFAVNGRGDVAFEASLFQGAAHNGIFLAERVTAVEVPTFTGPALAFAILLVACAGSIARRRHPGSSHPS